jgi:hypothetical protein
MKTTDDTSLPAGLLALARRGLVTLGAARRNGDIYRALPRAPRGHHSVAQLLDEERAPPGGSSP